MTSSGASDSEAVLMMMKPKTGDSDSYLLTRDLRAKEAMLPTR